MDSDSFLSLSFLINIYFQSVTINILLTSVIAFLLLLLSGLTTAAETALFSLNTSDKHEISENNNAVDHLINEMLTKSDHLKTTFIIINNLTNISVVILGSYILNQLFYIEGPEYLQLTFYVSILTLLILLIGEIFPLVYAAKNALALSRKTIPLFHALSYLCTPICNILVNINSSVNKLFGKKRDLSMEDLSMALELSSEEISEEKEMLEGIIKLYNITAVEIMTSRMDVINIDIKQSFPEVIKQIIDTGFSRMPVFSESLDNIKGILYIKDLLPYLNKPSNFRWQSLIRPAYFVPETKKIDDLLDEFKSNRVHFAVVVDEFGGTSGIVTLEDILEEIVGEINDEYDEVHSKYIRTEDGAFIFEAKILLMDFFKITGLEAKDFGKLTEEVDTLAGLILEIKGDFPEKKEILEYDNYIFQILDVNKKRILKVKFQIKDPVIDNKDIQE